MGKEMRAKYALLDMRPIQPSEPLDRASLPNFHNLKNGRTPFTTKLPAGYYKAAFAVVGYANSVESITVGSGYPTTVNATLRASSAQ
jgi:hypothetical protein